MGNDFFYLGYVMRLCSSSWFIRLVLVSFFVYPVHVLSAPHCWSFSTIPKGGGSSNALKPGQDEIKTSCKLSSGGGSSYHVCGDLGKPSNRTITESDKTGITIHYQFVKPNYFDDGFNFADEQFNFGSNLTNNYRNALLPNLINALNSDNCDLANSILGAMQNPDIYKDGDNDFLGFKNGSDKCVVKSDGSTECRGPSYKISKDKDGNTRVDIDPQNEWVRKLEDYARTKNSDTNNNPGAPGNGSSGSSSSGGGGSSIDEKRGHSGGSGGGGSSPNKKGDAEYGNNKEGDKGSSGANGKPGNGGGGGLTGSGKGDDDGDNEGKNSDIKLPKIDGEIDISKILEDAKSKLEDKVGGNYDISGGSCEPFNFTVMGRPQSVSFHCEIFSKMESTISPAFTLIWTALSIIIILSA